MTPFREMKIMHWAPLTAVSQAVELTCSHLSRGWYLAAIPAFHFVWRTHHRQRELGTVYQQVFKKNRIIVVTKASSMDTSTVCVWPEPWSSFPWCFEFPRSFLTKEIPWCFDCFQLSFSVFLGVFKRSEGGKNPWCLGGFRWVVSKHQGRSRNFLIACSQIVNKALSDMGPACLARNPHRLFPPKWRWLTEG